MRDAASRGNALLPQLGGTAVPSSAAAGSPSRPARIAAEAVGRTYHGRRGETVALDRFTLDIRDGEFVCLVGPSGCGKSTFLRIVAGLIKPTVGEVRIAASASSGPLCATVFQNYSVFPWRTVAENVRFGLDVMGVPRREARDRVDTWLDIVGLVQFRDAYPAALSGGMKQRVALARAFVVEPQVLLMDEPFAALDAHLRMVMQEELLRIWQQHQHTVLLVTHSLEEAILLGDRVVLMTGRPGRIKGIYDVPLERPRSSDQRGDAEFSRLEREIWTALHEDDVVE